MPTKIQHICECALYIPYLMVSCIPIGGSAHARYPAFNPDEKRSAPLIILVAQQAMIEALVAGQEMHTFE